MPGITGFIRSSSLEEDASLLDQMVSSMNHEPFYTRGNFSSRDLGVAAGWVSTDPGASLSGWNDSKTIGALFSGEEFALGTAGISGDAGTGSNRIQRLISLYERSGPDFLTHLNGWFSGLLLDLRERKVILFNDRYGLGRIYFHQKGDCFYFGSEAKSLLRVLPELRSLDSQGVAEWLSCGCVLQNRTLFKGVGLVPPGSGWVFSGDGSVKKNSYFDPHAWTSQSILSADEYYARLQETFPRILKSYLNGARPVGMSLTGGLDGRMIMSWSPRGPGELPCYTFNGKFRDCADVTIARKVAQACRQPHQTISVGDQFLAQFQKLAEQTVWITDGAMDVTGAAELYVNRLAREIAPVRLTGNYGSEILRGHVAFKPATIPVGIFASDLVAHSATAKKTYAFEAKVQPLAFIAFKQVPWHHFARFSLEQSQLTLRSPFLDNELVALAFRAPTEAGSNLKSSLHLIADGNPELGRIPTDRGLTYPPGQVAGRLHQSFQEFFVKAEYAYDYGMPDWLSRLDACVSPLHLERLFLGRQKFCHFRTWYRHQLAGFVQEVLLDKRALARSYVNGASIEPLIRSHIRGNRNHTLEIHKLLSLELLHRSLIETCTVCRS